MSTPSPIIVGCVALLLATMPGAAHSFTAELPEDMIGPWCRIKQGDDFDSYTRKIFNRDCDEDELLVVTRTGFKEPWYYTGACRFTKIEHPSPSTFVFTARCIGNKRGMSSPQYMTSELE